MRQRLAVLRAGASALALLAGTAVQAATFTFDTPGDFSDTIDVAGTYEITIGGASGGNATDHAGGIGALVGGTLFLGAGAIFSGLVGAAGADAPSADGGGGGGGLSFFRSGGYLAVAGGGGGAGRNQDGGAGRADTSGGDGGNASGYTSAGLGGQTANEGGGAGYVATPSYQSFPAAGGAAFNADGGDGTNTSGTGSAYGGETGPSWAGGGFNALYFGVGAAGGYGGGGGTAGPAGGGGGGWAGGGGGGGFENSLGSVSMATGYGGGGGGSYISSAFGGAYTETGGATGGAFVSLQLIESAPAAIPTPGAFALMGTSALAFAAVARSRRRRG